MTPRWYKHVLNRVNIVSFIFSDGKTNNGVSSAGIRSQSRWQVVPDTDTSESTCTAQNVWHISDGWVPCWHKHCRRCHFVHGEKNKQLQYIVESYPGVNQKSNLVNIEKCTSLSIFFGYKYLRLWENQKKTSPGSRFEFQGKEEKWKVMNNMQKGNHGWGEEVRQSLGLNWRSLPWTEFDGEVSQELYVLKGMKRNKSII